jgi:pimeloyl-ACP methyl ester carboxylesterase
MFLAQRLLVQEVDLRNGDIELPGSLSYPEGLGGVPLAIFVHGSGNIDRNGNQAGTFVQSHYIKTLSDSLNANGIAFFRYDKRTAVQQNLANLGAITLYDFADDVKAVLQHFKNDDRFTSIVLLGHSQCALVGLLSIDASVSKYISIAGAGETIDKTLVGQIAEQSPELSLVCQGHIDELMEKDTIVSVNPMLMQLFAPRNQKFLKSWMQIDPVKIIKSIEIPILILNGDADLQVKVADAEMLKAAQPNARLKVISKMNHVLKEVNSMAENQKAYMDENVPLSHDLVAEITQFIKN